MLAIETLYLGPTNYRGSRVKARVLEGKWEGKPTRQQTITWDDALDSEANHRAAAATLIRSLGWTSADGYGRWVVGSSERGYVFVCDTRHGNARLDV